MPGDFKFRPVPRTFKPAKAQTRPRSPVTGPPGPDAGHARPATKPTRRFSESLLGVRFYQGTREPYSRGLFENSITRQPTARYPSGFRRPTQTDEHSDEHSVSVKGSVVLDGKGICLAASGPTRGTFSSDEIEPSRATPWSYPEIHPARGPPRPCPGPGPLQEAPRPELAAARRGPTRALGLSRPPKELEHPRLTRRSPWAARSRPAGRSNARKKTHPPPLDDRRLSGPTTGRESISTNLADAGLRSVARNNKATRLLTRPGQTTKSSAKDLSLRIVKLQSAS